MAALIENNQVKGTVITSRNFQEAFKIQEGDNNYAVLAGWIEIGQQQIDMFAKLCGTVTGYAVMNKRRQIIYSDEKNGKHVGFLNRNVYENPIKTKFRQSDVELWGTAASLGVEFVMKQTFSGLHSHFAKKANYKAVEQIYSFLYNYVMTDYALSNKENAQMELAKIRNGLPLPDKKRTKMFEAYKGKEAVKLEDIPTMSVLNNNPQLCESLSYQLFDLYCQKFGDANGVLARELENENFNYKGLNTLLRYYDYLGFTGRQAKEMIRVNANRYDTISRDQAYYLQFGREIVQEFSFDIPGVNFSSAQERCKFMAQFDPYQLRRRMVQTVGKGTAMGLAGLLEKRPDIVMNGGALALSQFRMEDGNAPAVMEKMFRENGVGLDVFNLMLGQAKEIAHKVR